MIKTCSVNIKGDSQKRQLTSFSYDYQIKVSKVEKKAIELRNTTEVWKTESSKNRRDQLHQKIISAEKKKKLFKKQ